MASDATPNAALRPSGKPGRGLTAGQIGFVLNDIAATANQIDTLVIQLQGNASNVGLVDSLAGAVLSLSHRIGWAADMAAARIPGSCGALFGDAAHWMMPPSFHHDDRDVDQAQGDENHG